MHVNQMHSHYRERTSHWRAAKLSSIATILVVELAGLIHLRLVREHFEERFVYGLVYTGAGIYFMVALALGYWFLFGPARGKCEVDDACPACVPVEPLEPLRERDASSDGLPATRNMR